MSNIINPYRFAAAPSGAEYVVITSGTAITTSGDYKYIKFYSGDTFEVTDAGNASGSNTIEYVIVGGGGGGGAYEGAETSTGGKFKAQGGMGGAGVVLIRYTVAA